MSAFPAHPAWDFVTRLYAQPGVAPACLDLQERHGIDVTLMLLCLWRGTVDGRPLADRLGPLAAAARDWREATVLPIRIARRWLKQQPGQQSLYRTVLTAEIDCEHGELLMLATHADDLCGAPATAGSPSAIAQNLAAFLREAAIVAGEPDGPALGTILAAAGAADEIGRVLPVA